MIRAERGGYLATGHGNSVPRFHIAWGSGPGVIEPFVHKVKEFQKSGKLKILWRHKVTELIKMDGAVIGVKGQILEPSQVLRGEASSRQVIGDFSINAKAVIIASGGIGANHEWVRKFWPARMEKAPDHMLSGVPDSVDEVCLLSLKSWVHTLLIWTGCGTIQKGSIIMLQFGVDMPSVF